MEQPNASSHAGTKVDRSKTNQFNTASVSNTSSSLNNIKNATLKHNGLYGHSATEIYDGAAWSLYIIGGADAEGKYYKDTRVVDIATRNSKSIEHDKSLDLERNFHSVISYNKSLYLFGGKSNGYFNDVLKFDPKESKWERINVKGTPPSKRYGHSACLWGHKMVIFGGYDNDSIASNELFFFDLHEHQWKVVISARGEVPPTRYHHTCAVHNDTMYLFGGHGADSHIWAFSFTTVSWNKINIEGKDKPSPRYGHTMNLIGGDNSPMLVVYGGTDGTKEFNDMWIFNIKDRTWKSILPKKENSIPPRYFHTSFVHEGSLVLFGGKNSENSAVDDFSELPLRINFSLQLPEEIWFKIFLLLNLTAVGRICRVSKEWKRIASDGELWKFMSEKYGAEIDREAPVSVNYKRYLRIMRRKAIKNWKVDKSGELAEKLSIKVTMVGEYNVGKTTYGVLSTTGERLDPANYVPTLMDNADFMMRIKGSDPVNCSLWDVRADTEYSDLRVLSYPGTDVFFMMFSLIGPTSLSKIKEYWYPEVVRQVPDAIRILVGTKEDLVHDEDTLSRLASRNMQPVTQEEAMKLAREIGAVEYITISSFTGKNVEMLLQRAVQLASDRAAEDNDVKDGDKKRCLVM